SVRRPLANGHRSVAIHAERTNAFLALTTGVHGEEHRIVRRVGMHASGPLFVVARVTLFASLWLDQVGARKADGLGCRRIIATSGLKREQRDGAQPRAAHHGLAPLAIHVRIAHCTPGDRASPGGICQGLPTECVRTTSLLQLASPGLTRAGAPFCPSSSA